MSSNPTNKNNSRPIMRPDSRRQQDIPRPSIVTQEGQPHPNNDTSGPYPSHYLELPTFNSRDGRYTEYGLLQRIEVLIAQIAMPDEGEMSARIEREFERRMVELDRLREVEAKRRERETGGLAKGLAVRIAAQREREARDVRREVASRELERELESPDLGAASTGGNWEVVGVAIATSTTKTMEARQANFAQKFAAGMVSASCKLPFLLMCLFGMGMLALEMRYIWVFMYAFMDWEEGPMR